MMFFREKKWNSFVTKLDQDTKFLLQKYKDFADNNNSLILTKPMPESFGTDIFGKEKFVLKFALCSHTTHLFYKIHKPNKKELFIFKKKSLYIVSSTYPQLNPLNTFFSYEDAFKYCLAFVFKK